MTTQNSSTVLDSEEIVTIESLIKPIELPPVDFPRDEENYMINVYLKTEGDMPEHHQQRYHWINEKGVDISTLHKENFPMRMETGFRTINDYMTVFHEDEKHDKFLMSQIQSTMGQIGGLVCLEKILYEERLNHDEMDLQPIFDMLLDEGFTKVLNIFSHLRFFKFNEKNLAYMLVDIKTKSTLTMPLVEGFVTEDLAQRIAEKMIPMMRRYRHPVTITQLDGYKSVTPDKKEGDFNSVILTDKMDYALPEFYPWIKMPLVDYFAEFLASKANVLVLIGPPGTGKSTLIRTMIRELNIRTLVAYKPEVVISSDFIQACQHFLASTMGSTSMNTVKWSINSQAEPTSEGNNGTFRLPRNPRSANPLKKTRQPCAVVVEDADEIMESRRNGNFRMSEILNATNGIASDNKSKFILSTNLKDIDRIDPALLRPGRCFDILCFRGLTAAEATVVREVKGMSKVEFDVNRTYKLAEVLTDSVVQNKNEPIIKPRFGFL